ncbi:hypothetical protein BDZ45DRAFT_682997 [Acephala macrosclerotiorum]|nr:hypothetical protein BDZ45DRAFT_682997 [Acephala macrosclerotiorum]
MAREAHKLLSAKYPSWADFGFQPPKLKHSEAIANDENARQSTLKSNKTAASKGDSPPESPGTESAYEEAIGASLNGVPGGVYRITLKTRLPRWLSKEDYHRDMMTHHAAGIFKENIYDSTTNLKARNSANSKSYQNYSSSVRNNASAIASYESGYDNIYGSQSRQESPQQQRAAGSPSNRGQHVTEALGGLDISNLPPNSRSNGARKTAGDDSTDDGYKSDDAQSLETSSTSDVHIIRDYMQATIDMYGLMGWVVHHEGLSFEFRPTGTPDIVDRDARVKSIFRHFNHYAKFRQLGRSRFDSLEEIGYEFGFEIQLPEFGKDPEQDEQSTLPDDVVARLDEPNDTVYNGLEDRSRRAFDIVYRLGLQLGFILKTAEVQWVSGPIRCLAFSIQSPPQ